MCKPRLNFDMHLTWQKRAPASVGRSGFQVTKLPALVHVSTTDGKGVEEGNKVNRNRVRNCCNLSSLTIFLFWCRPSKMLSKLQPVLVSAGEMTASQRGLLRGEDTVNSELATPWRDSSKLHSGTWMTSSSLDWNRCKHESHSLL